MRITGILKKLCEFLWEPLNGKNVRFQHWYESPLKKTTVFVHYINFSRKLSKNNGNGCFDQNNHYRMYLYYIMECMYHILWSINHAISFILMPFNFAKFFTNYLNLICRLQNSSDWEYGCNSGIYVYYIDTK